MTDHAHTQYVAGCFRCDLSRDEVTSGYVTEEMIERGAVEARAWGVKSSHGDWSDEETQRNCARDILAAIAPLIAAQALEDAADAYQWGGWADLPQAKGDLATKRRQAEHAAAFLRNRAAKLREAGR